MVEKQLNTTVPLTIKDPESSLANPEFKAAVVVSRKWDALEAGREVIVNLMDAMDGKKPDFVLLFSTIHFKDHGGFKELLHGVHQILPKDTPLIGGTVPGFITPQGCYTRGVTAMGIHYPNMEIATAIAHGTKRNPLMAGHTVSKELKGKLKGSKYSNGIIFSCISANQTFKIPGFIGQRVFRTNNSFVNNIMSSGAALFFSLSEKILQKGMGHEEEILQVIGKAFKDYSLIGCSNMDNNKMIYNFQFFNDRFYENSVVLLGLKTDLDFKLNTTYGLEETNKEINVTSFKNGGRTIHKIDGKPALPKLKEKFGWGSWFFDDIRMHRRTFFTPLGFTQKCPVNGDLDILQPEVMGYVFGDDIICGYKMNSPHLKLLSASGKAMITSVSDNLKFFDSDVPKVALIMSCAARLESLGSHVFTVREKLDNYFKDTPYLLLYTGGEDTYSRKTGLRHLYESFNVGLFS